MDLGALRLSEERLNYSSKTYPTLESMVKAARARVFFGFVCKLCIDIEL